MSTGTATLLVALVGVVGTLLSPLTTAWVSTRTRLQEFEMQQQASAVVRREESAAADLERRREAYTALNSSARRWRILLMEDARALSSGSSASERTEEARQAFHDDFARVQMLVPDLVLDAANRVRLVLADAHTRLGRQARDSTTTEAEWRELQGFLLSLWDVITEMQAAMRKDLGVGSGAPVPSERSGAYRDGVVGYPQVPGS